MRKTDGPEKGGPALTPRRKGQLPHQRDRTNSLPQKDRPTPTPRGEGQPIPRREGQRSLRGPSPRKAKPSTLRRNGEPLLHWQVGRAKSHPEKERPTPTTRRTGQTQPQEGGSTTTPQEGRANPNSKKEAPKPTPKRQDQFPPEERQVNLQRGERGEGRGDIAAPIGPRVASPSGKSETQWLFQGVSKLWVRWGLATVWFETVIIHMPNLSRVCPPIQDMKPEKLPNTSLPETPNILRRVSSWRGTSNSIRDGGHRSIRSEAILRIK